MISNGIGKVVLDTSIGTGPIGLVNGGLDFQRDKLYMSVDHNVKFKADNNTTQQHNTNLFLADSGPRSQLSDMSTYTVHPNNRSTVNPTVETQMGLKGNTKFVPTTYKDGVRNTMKQTTLFSHTGAATKSVPSDMLHTHYTTKDNTGGSTTFSINKDPIYGYIPGGVRFTGSVTHVGSGDITYKTMDNDKMHVEGNGTYIRAAPELSRINKLSKQQIGEYHVNPNRLQYEDNSRTDVALISGLLSNCYSVYNDGKNLECPNFMCNSRDVEFSPVTSTLSPKQEISNRDISGFSVYNSKKNANDVIVQNGSNTFENPLLFNNKTFKSTATLGRCY